MLQQIISRCFRAAVLIVAALLLAIPAACNEPPRPAPAAMEKNTRVASLVPAVTNMLLALDMGDRLVAVSNYDTDPRVADLPRVGDLLSVDWEQLLEAQPTHMVIQQDPAKVPPGLQERAAEHQIELVSMPLTRLEDVGTALQRLGSLFAPPRGQEWLSEFRSQIQAASAPTDPGPAPTVLLALSADFQFVAGRENYLDDLLVLAGGENVISAEMPPYPTLDDETLLQLRPERVVVILPAATPAQIDQARATFSRFQPAWEISGSALTLITDPYAMVPGWSVINVLRQFTAATARE